MKKIGVIGLGIMGHGMADNFLKNGYELYVWNRSPEKAKDLVKDGAVLCKSPKEVAEKADMVFDVTANDKSSKRTWTARDGILAGATKDSILISCATLSTAWFDELAKLCKQKDITFFDMPMTGSRIGAETGRLTLLVGGDKAKLEKLKPTLKAISEKVVYFGPTGQGLRYKLLLNMLQAIHIIGYAEVLKIAQASGMDIDKVADALAIRPGGVPTGEAKDGFHKQPDPIGFSVEWIVKDLDYAKKFANTLDTPMLDDVLSRYHDLLDSGKAQTDWTNVYEE
jgi:3-hydroxyisobutyrate dehydrogenase-like beta-hydroxyacid dehydrogenase